ncbi:MAG: TadE/TadG family type IV pilus assembly protein [Terracidiphilus sp.]
MKNPNGLRGQAMALMPGMRRAAASKNEHAEARFPGGRVGSRLHSGKEGSAIVEFALMMPVLLILIVGLFGFGLYISYAQDLTQAVGNAGETLAHERGASTPLNPCADALTAIQAASPLYMSPTKITLVVKFTPYGGTTPVVLGGNSCSGSDDNTELGGKTPGGTVFVSAQYSYPCLYFSWLNLANMVCQPLYAQVTEYVY